MSENTTSALMVEILRDVQAAVARLERGALRHDRKLDEHLLRFAAIEASIRDARDELESIVRLELGRQFANFQAQVGHRIGALAERLAAFEASVVSPG